MQFTNLRLLNWYNFTEVDISLSSRMFLIGPNACGKSNLLDAFRFLRDIAKPGGGFQKAVIDRGGLKNIRCLAARRHTNITLDVDISEIFKTKKISNWRYFIEFNQDNLRRPILKEEKIWKNNDLIIKRPNEDDKEDPARLTQTYLEQISVNKKFRDIVRFFESIHYLHLVPQIIRDPELSVGRSSDPFGGDFLERLANINDRTRNARLRKIQNALKVSVPQLRDLQLDRDKRGTPHLKAIYEHWRHKGAYQDEKQFSDGTLRFLGLLWSLLEGEGPLLLEEPELSLHTGVIKKLARLIWRLQRVRDRQVLMSTHSYDLVSDRGIGGEEVLFFIPTNEGTKVEVGKDDNQIKILLEEGASIAEAVIPITEPPDIVQLDMFKV